MIDKILPKEESQFYENFNAKIEKMRKKLRDQQVIERCVAALAARYRLIGGEFGETRRVTEDSAVERYSSQRIGEHYVWED